MKLFKSAGVALTSFLLASSVSASDGMPNICEEGGLYEGHSSCSMGQGDSRYAPSAPQVEAIPNVCKSQGRPASDCDTGYVAVDRYVPSAGMR